MLRNRNPILAGGLLVTMLTTYGFSREVMAEEYVWARFYGANQPSGYATNGFGSYYVPKSMVTSKQQTDPIKKADNQKPTGKDTAETRPAEPVVESETPKPAGQTQKSFWKRLTFRK